MMLQEVSRWAMKHASEVKELNNLVKVVHGDRSAMFFTNAHAIIKDGFLCIFSQKQGIQVFLLNDLYDWGEFKEVAIEEIEHGIPD